MRSQGSGLSPSWVARKVVTYDELQAVAGSLWWLQSDPDHGGVQRLMRSDRSGTVVAVTPSGLPVGSRLHAYGGGSFAVTQTAVWLVGDDGSLFHQPFDGMPGIDVVEVNQPDRATRRKRGKTDAIDADAAARAVLSGRATTLPKTADGPAADMRVLRLAKESAVKARTQAMNQLKAILLVLDPDLRELLTGLTNPALIATCAALDDDRGEAAFAMRLLAGRVQSLSQEIKELTKRTTKAVRTSRPQLLELVGVGPDSAAVLLIAAGDNSDRLTDEASFAALCGVSPVEQPSGKTSLSALGETSRLVGLA
ncbi:transposase [Kitasatospora sp. NPDC056651]|uniref:IS110 family transposase n=1 Tax=Kitasatospora sp. NPDC056651 TaxID=3345892 RepID=UPI00367DD8B1